MKVARLAAEWEGVLDLAELRSCGLDRHAVRWREQNGRLHRLHDGVYAVGHPNVSLKGQFVAAFKACGSKCPISHRASAAQLSIRDWTHRDIEVTSTDGVDHRHRGIEVHRSSLLTRSDCVIRDRMLATNATWTVVALAAVLPRTELRRAVREALRLKIVSVRGILALLERLGPVRGCRALREILTHALPTRSELEDVVLGAIVSGGFVLPEVNEPLLLGGRKVIPDFMWPEQRVILEADGARWHGDALSRADDAERQALLEAHGFTVLRVRWDQAVGTPRNLVARLARAGVPLL
ncbi:MAG: type IV toxin-antitoxin system AbiEi family antitoxin domain-containing protein [Actinomycetota bacterium]|nr:type IV toxin-antitoxin system AbiEi family antitoxin domain-containing protein [Actinomycetota bacterium]